MNGTPNDSATETLNPVIMIMIPNFDCNRFAAGAAHRGPGAPRRRLRGLGGTTLTLYRATVTQEPTVRGTRTRGTRQAQALADALAGLPGFCSAQEIHAELRRRGEHVGLATVYRHLQALSEQGSVDAIRDGSGETLYRQCETSVEVEGRAVEQWADRVAREAGFTDVGHTVELFGLCPQCAG